MSIWNDDSLKPSSGDFVKFEIESDHVNGAQILDVGVHTWPEKGKPGDPNYQAEKQVPKFELLLTKDNRTHKAGQKVTMTVGPRQAIERLFELRPEIGDTFSRFELTKVDRSGGRTRKEFTIEVERAGSASAASVPSADDLA